MIKDFIDVSAKMKSFNYVIEGLRQYNYNIRNYENTGIKEPHKKFFKKRSEAIIEIFNKSDGVFYNSFSNAFLYNSYLH